MRNHPFERIGRHLQMELQTDGVPADLKRLMPASVTLREVHRAGRKIKRLTMPMKHGHFRLGM